MVFVHYRRDQFGPTYVIHLTVTESWEVEYLVGDDKGSLHFVMQPASDIVHNGKPNSITYESISPTGFYTATMFPDSSMTEFNNQKVVASWALYFSTGEPFSTPDLSSQLNNETKWWTISLLRGKLEPSADLEVIIRFDCCTGVRPSSPAAFRLVEDNENDFSCKSEKCNMPTSYIVCSHVDLPTRGKQERFDGVSLIELPKRHRKKTPWKAAARTNTMLSEPEINLQMFDESFVILPSKRIKL